MNKRIGIIGAVMFFMICGLFFSCKNGVTVDGNSFRSIADFLVPAVDEPTGKAVFTPEFTLAQEYGPYDQIDAETSFLRLTGASESETVVSARLKLNGLVNSSYGNVRTTASWKPLDAASTGLVKDVKFDKYDLMVFFANTGSTGYDPSGVEVRIVLNSFAANQLGILTFKFEYAKSVYDSTRCVKEYQLFIATGSESKPVAVFSRMRVVDADESFVLDGSKAAYTASYTDFAYSSVSSTVTQSLAIDLLYLDPAHPVTLRTDSANGVFSVTDIAPMTISGNKGTINFKLQYNPGVHTLPGASAACNLLIEDTAGYYANLPLSIPLSALRKIPDEPDVKNSFAADGDASPWKWRAIYRIQTANFFGSKTYQVYQDDGYNGGQNSPSDFIAGYILQRETITQTKKNAAVGGRSGAMARFLDCSANTGAVGVGDTTQYAAWLFSAPVTLYEGFEYNFKVSIYIGSSGSTHNGDAARTSFYIASTGGTINDSFKLADVKGPAITVSGSASGAGSLITHVLPAASGWCDLEYVIVPSAKTQVRFIAEKGNPVWDDSYSSGMRSGEVAVSNVVLGYN